MSLIKLEIAADYPIEWDFCRVFRDLIQNFYDSLMPEEFGKKFRYSFKLENDGYHVVMETQKKDFSYEWLTYVGGSTKTDKPGDYIGKYGEGFKMAALRIMQMGGMSLTMHSQNWLISPVKYIETIDDRKISMLGYDYSEVENDGITRLEIIGVHTMYKSILEEALLDFCYPENPLFGPLVGRGQQWELYERSEKIIPCRQYDPNLKGILYVNNLARGRLSIPVIINYKREIYYDSRSREPFDNLRTIDLLHEIAKKLDPQTSLFVLEMLKRKWNEYPKNAYDIDTKYYLVCQLVRNIANDKAAMTTFTSRYKDLVYIERKSSDTIRNKLIDETKEWAKDNNTKRIVNPIFRLLGAESLVMKYQNRKDSLYILPNALEFNRAGILYEAVNSIIPLVLTEKMPDIIIDESVSGVFNPLQFAERKYVKVKGQKNKKYEINKLLFRHEDFQNEAYNESLIKMAEALLHVYGTDRSSLLTLLLTHLGKWILDGSEIIERYRKKWSKAG